jgi:hypothetical protein
MVVCWDEPLTRNPAPFPLRHHRSNLDGQAVCRPELSS